MSTELKQQDFSLLIPCYNNIEGLVLSLQSVSYYPDRFIIVVVDDGSNVPVSIDSIKSKAHISYEIIVLRSGVNKGIIHALNKGLAWIEENTDSKYIARLDCGDVCDPARFYKQMDYMKNHPETGLLGSWCVFEDKKTSRRYYYKTPVGHERILRAMYFKNIFIHPTVMFRTELLRKTGYYSFDFVHAEDYAFFWQLIRINQSYVLDEFLVTCEINFKGVSFKNRQEQLKKRIEVIAKYGSNPLLKTAGILRTYILRCLPERLVLPLKTLANRK